jgi:hypothetical protein
VLSDDPEKVASPAYAALTVIDAGLERGPKTTKLQLQVFGAVDCCRGEPQVESLMLKEEMANVTFPVGIPLFEPVMVATRLTVSPTCVDPPSAAVGENACNETEEEEEEEAAAAALLVRASARTGVYFNQVKLRLKKRKTPGPDGSLANVECSTVSYTLFEHFTLAIPSSY